MAGLTFRIFGQDVSASSTLNGVANRADDAGKKVGSAFKGIAGAAAGAAGLVGGISFFTGALEEAEEAQKVGAQTAAVIKSTGGAAKVTADQIGDLAGAISAKAGIDDEAIQSGANLLLTFTNIRNEAGKGNDIFNQTTQIMTDLSVATGTSMTSAATMLGKALNDPIAGVSKLTKVGVTFTQQQKDQIKALAESGDAIGAQKIILGELTKEFGGSAAAQATSMDHMKVAFGNLQEQVGTALMPVITALADTMSNTVIPAFSVLTSWLQKNWSWLKYVAGGVVALWAAFKAYQVGVVAIAAVRSSLAVMRGAILATGDAAVAARAKMLAMSSSLKGLGIIGGVSLAAYGLGKAISSVVDGGKAWIGIMENGAQTMAEFRDALVASNGALDDNVRLMLAKRLQDTGLADKAAAAGISLRDFTTAVAGNDAAFGKLIQQWEAGGAPSDDTLISAKLLHEQYQKSAGSATKLAGANDKATGAQNRNTAAVNTGKSAMERQKQTLDGLLASYDKFVNRNADAQISQLNFDSAISKATEQVKENGRSLSTNTEKGRANRVWLLEQIKSVGDVATKMKEQGRSVTDVNARLQQNATKLRASALNAGFNKDQVDRLMRSLKLMPTSKGVKFNMNGLDAAQARLDTLRATLGRLANANIYIGSSVNANGQIAITGGGRYAQGTGFVKGNRSALVGEFGPERVVLPHGSRVDTASMTRSGRAGSGDTYIIQIPGAILSTADAERAVSNALESSLNNGRRITAPRGSFVMR